MAAPLFSLGELVATPAALALLVDISKNTAGLLAPPQAGDRGKVVLLDPRENELSVMRGFRILSSYQVAREMRGYGSSLS
jgi:hypothetical protein